MIEARGLVVAYGDHVVLRDFDLTVEPGAALGVTGPSGCGKSTAARVVALLQPPAAGTVTIDGTRVGGWRFRAQRALRQAVGVVFQNPRLSVDPRLTLFDVVAEPLRASKRDDEAAPRVAELASTVELTDELLGRRAHEVSDGQLQRACLARALVLSPRYLVCDEMTSMLDASTQARLVGVVERYRQDTGAGVLAISHDVTLLGRWCDRVERMAADGARVPAEA